MKRTIRYVFCIIAFAVLFMLAGCAIIKHKNDNKPTPLPTGQLSSFPALPSVSPIAQILTEPVTYYVNGEGVRIRESSSTDSEVLCTLSHQTAVQWLEEVNGWSKVSYNNITGYIRNDLINATLPTPKPTSDVNGDAPVTIIIKKADRKLQLWLDGDLIGNYNIGLGWTPEGDKEKEGDGKTPEGDYYVCVRNSHSNFYLSLGVSYPNKADAKRGLDANIISQDDYNEITYAIDRGRKPPWNTRMGGAIMIHGRGGDCDWTAGCIAVDDEVMDTLWEHCDIGTPIIITP